MAKSRFAFYAPTMMGVLLGLSLSLPPAAHFHASFICECMTKERFRLIIWSGQKEARQYDSVPLGVLPPFIWMGGSKGAFSISRGGDRVKGS